jgi:hypothetical protein
MTVIEISDVIEHENGDATYVFEMDNDSAKIVTELGMKLLMYCGACGVSTQQVLAGRFDEYGGE